ncbi:MAG: HNH endonuclease [bacterium]|nr:HNH endonuclease [bacterium]
MSFDPEVAQARLELTPEQDFQLERKSWSYGERKYWEQVDVDLIERQRTGEENPKPKCSVYDLSADFKDKLRALSLNEFHEVLVKSRHIAGINQQEKRLQGRNRWATQEQRLYAWIAERGRCAYCAVDVNMYGSSKARDKMNIDHIIPYSEGGRTLVENLVCSCKACNTVKNSLPTIWFLEKMQEPDGIAWRNEEYAERMAWERELRKPK